MADEKNTIAKPSEYRVERVMRGQSRAEIEAGVEPAWVWAVLDAAGRRVGGGGYATREAAELALQRAEMDARVRAQPPRPRRSRRGDAYLSGDERSLGCGPDEY